MGRDEGEDKFDGGDEGTSDEPDVPEIRLDGESDGPDHDHPEGPDSDSEPQYPQNILSHEGDHTDIDVSNTNISTAESDLEADLDSNSYSESSSESDATQYTAQYSDLDQDTDQIQDSRSESISDVESVQESSSESNPDVDVNVDNVVDVDDPADPGVIYDVDREVNVDDRDTYVEENVYYGDTDRTIYDPRTDSDTGSVDPSSDPTTAGDQVVVGSEDPYMVLDTQKGQVDVLVGEDPTTINMGQSELSQLLDLVNWLDGNAPSDVLDLLYQLLAYLLETFYGLIPLDNILNMIQQIAEYALSGELGLDVLNQLLGVLETATSPLYAATEILKFLGDLDLGLDALLDIDI
ncbi:hypothetical protein [Methanopyrus kandleri]|uniref:Uncharacterized protein n=2 Tax=Methanopyrus kandleri TaxID=2320 RepID=Q8TXL7_METKA|nr:hypothetical protein [Methanopyrus kandleri]AAM01860.1 Uncharacterized protein MK0645 [Methanopyrus kandleri AV19]HII70130.1 hypothetical protein [Methanopyrus kandleri]